MSVPSYSFHSLSLKLLNKRISFSFPPLKLPNKGREEYFKIIIFIHFYSIPFSPPKKNQTTCPKQRCEFRSIWTKHWMRVGPVLTTVWDNNGPTFSRRLDSPGGP